jgi:hypothetical protein
MYIRKRRVRAWAAIPAIVLMVAISVLTGPSVNAAYTTQVPLGAAGNVGSTGAQTLVAVVTIPRLPSTSTNDVHAPLKPVNFIQGFALGFALVLIGGLLLLGLRRSV